MGIGYASKGTGPPIRQPSKEVWGSIVKWTPMLKSSWLRSFMRLLDRYGINGQILTATPQIISTEIRDFYFKTPLSLQLKFWIWKAFLQSVTHILNHSDNPLWSKHVRSLASSWLSWCPALQIWSNSHSCSKGLVVSHMIHLSSKTQGRP